MLYQPILKYSTPYYVGKTENFTSFPLHMHCEIEILYCQKGSLEATVNGRNFTVRAGEALLLESMADHALSSGKGGCSIMTVEYGPMLLKEKFAELSSLKFSAPVISLAEPKNIAIRDALCALSSLCGNNSPPAELCTVGELYKLSAALGFAVRRKFLRRRKCRQAPYRQGAYTDLLKLSVRRDCGRGGLCLRLFKEPFLPEFQACDRNELSQLS